MCTPRTGDTQQEPLRADWAAGWAWFGNLPETSRFLVGSGYKEEGLGAWAEVEDTLRVSRRVSKLSAADGLPGP